jgi:hypothetical protein
MYPFDSAMRRQITDATIRVMPKFKPARGKKKASPTPPGGLACVILVIAGIALVMLFLYYAMTHANG